MRITIGLPMYGGADGMTVRSLLSTQELLIKSGIDVVFDMELGGSIITKVRNRIVRRFQESLSDYLVFIDADMVFDAEDILALVQSDADVCAINYMQRKPEVKWSNRPVLDENNQIEAHRENGRVWVKTEAAGTGLMAIHRRAIERMYQACAEFKYDDDGEETLSLFDFKIIDGHYYGEDYLFCKRWIDVGGEIWTLADATTGHIGDTSYTGNYCDFLGGVSGG